ncbi:MAG: GvpL/GvpF family gas vesicle protein [Bacillota bacterium]
MTKNALYLYAIGRGDGGLTLSGETLRGVDTIFYDGLAAFFSPVSDGEHMLSREAMMSHQKIVGTLWSQAAVIPISFGTVLRDRSAVIKILQMNSKQIKATLNRLAGCMEVGLKVFWKKDVFAARFGKQDPGVAELIKKARESGNEQPYPLMTRVGEMVENKVRQARSTFEREVHHVLAAVAEDAVLNDILTIHMVCNAAYLIRKEEEQAFDNEVSRLLEPRTDEFDVRYTGPWPPYNFARLQLEPPPERR